MFVRESAWLEKRVRLLSRRRAKPEGSADLRIGRLRFALAGPSRAARAQVLVPVVPVNSYVAVQLVSTQFDCQLHRPYPVVVPAAVAPVGGTKGQSAEEQNCAADGTQHAADRLRAREMHSAHGGESRTRCCWFQWGWWSHGRRGDLCACGQAAARCATGNHSSLHARLTPRR